MSPLRRKRPQPVAEQPSSAPSDPAQGFVSPPPPLIGAGSPGDNGQLSGTLPPPLGAAAAGTPPDVGLATGPPGPPPGRAAPVPPPPAAAPVAGAAGEPGTIPEDWAQLLRTMIIVRSFDDEVAAALAPRGDTPARCNESVVAVLGSLLRPGDVVVSSEPAHLAVLAGGAPLAATLAELLGLPQGLCGGSCGPGRLIDLERAAFGIDTPFGRSPQLAAGAALAGQCLGEQRVTVAVVGPATIRTGVLGDLLRLTGQWRLPLVLVLTRRGEIAMPAGEAAAPGEPSQFVGGSVQDGGADPDGGAGLAAAQLAASGIERVTVDRDDVLAVRGAMARAFERARGGAIPTLLDALNPAAAPASGEPASGSPGGVPADPILRLALAVLRSGSSMPEALDELRDRSRAEVRAARDLVRSWAVLDGSSVLPAGEGGGAAGTQAER